MNKIAQQESSHTETQRTSPAKTISRWITEGVIRPNTTAETHYILERFPVVIDPNALIDPDVQEPEMLRPRTQEETTRISTDIEKLERERLYREVVYDLIHNGVIEINLALLVGYNLRPSQVQSYGGHNRLIKTIYDSPDAFAFDTLDRQDTPLGFDKPDELIVSRRVEYEQKLATYLDDAGISLADANIREIILKSIIAHEYGHAVLGSLIRQNARAKLEQREFSDPILATNQSIAEIYGGILDSFPLESEVMSRLNFYPESNSYSPRSTSDERIARGFEFEMMRIQLRKDNVAEKDIDLIVEKFSADFKIKFRDEFIELFDTAKASGLPLPGILLCLGRLREKEGLEPSAREAVNYSVAHIGYGYALTKSELSEWLFSMKSLYANVENKRPIATSSSIIE